MRAVAGSLAVAAVLAAACTSGSHSGPSPAPSTSAVPSSTGAGSAGRTAGSTAPSSTAPAGPTDWPMYHGDLLRTGVSAGMPAASGSLRVRRVSLDGPVYAAPIVVGGLVFVGTERNSVYALTPSGAVTWRVNLGPPTNRSALPCGNIDPLGITGTPVYDLASDSVFVVASLGDQVRHDLVALDPLTGRQRWRRSVDLPGADAQVMQQRGALTVLGGRVWVPFGGLAGDCGAYKGRVVGVPVAGGSPIEYTVPTTREAGIWAPPGPSVLNNHLLVAVGNGESVGGRYDYSDSVLELNGTTLVDSFSPTTWAEDNRVDADLGSQGPTVVQGKWIFIAGKSGTAYVLRVGRLGGIGGEVAQAMLCASYGGTAVVGDVVYVPCSDGVRAVRVSATGQLSELWHTDSAIAGSPVVGGGRVYALDQAGGVLHALDLGTGRPREQVAVDVTSRFATPAISGSRLFVPTMTGLSIVDTAR